MKEGSGINMTRIIMQMALSEMNSADIQEIVPDEKAREIKEKFHLEGIKPTSKVYPLVSSVAAPDLPSRDLTDRLVDNFNRKGELASDMHVFADLLGKAQFMLPTLYEPSFRTDVGDVFNGSSDSYQNFVVRMVIAISMQKLHAQYAGLADSYYLAAMPFLKSAIEKKDLGTLQCLVLIAQYSMVTPTRAASYWVVGLASKICESLGLCDEATIAVDPRSGEKLGCIETDMRRRLYWIILSMELGLAHSLGRPSSFACTFDHINVRFFEPFNDENITPSGVIPGSPLSAKKRLSAHFLSMRPLQLEIRRMLYLKRRAFPRDADDPWFSEMERKLWNWQKSCPQEDGGSGLDETWYVILCSTSRSI